MSLSAPPDPRRPKGDSWSPDIHPLRRVERRRQQRLRRRKSATKGAAVVVVVAVVAAGALFALLRPGAKPAAPKPSGAPVSAPTDPTLAWGLRVGSTGYVTVFTVPPGGMPAAVVIPGDTLVDVPSGPPTVGRSVVRSGLLVAAVQATLAHRIGHVAVTDERGLQALVDTAGGASITLDAPVTLGKETVGPGSVRLTGRQTIAYLGEARDDAALRWEDVLTGLLPSARTGGWAAVASASDDPTEVASLLTSVGGADVEELPTALTGLGRTKDPDGVRDLVATRFPASAPLVKTIVLDGVGYRGVATDVVARVAPAGFWVVATQNMRRFNQDETQVVAASESYLDAANQVATLLGVGRVYVGVQPTGVADVTIVVGKDYVRA